jgi:hypothetical protein
VPRTSENLFIAELPRTPLWRSSQDPTSSTHLGEWAAGRCLPLRFIADSSPSVCLVGMSSTHLDNSSFQATNHKEHRNHIALKLLAEGSVVVLAMALGWWGMWNLGSYTLLSQTQPEPIYVAGCPVSELLQKSPARRGGVGQGRGCSHEGSTHPITSRQPGVRLVEHARLDEHGHGSERHRDDRVPPRTSENSPSTL